MVTDKLKRVCSAGMVCEEAEEEQPLHSPKGHADRGQGHQSVVDMMGMNRPGEAPAP